MKIIYPSKFILKTEIWVSRIVDGRGKKMFDLSELGSAFYKENEQFIRLGVFIKNL